MRWRSWGRGRSVFSTTAFGERSPPRTAAWRSLAIASLAAFSQSSCGGRTAPPAVAGPAPSAASRSFMLTASVPRGSVSGLVLDQRTLRPVRGAQLFITTARAGAEADSAGRFVLAGLPPGTFILEARALGCVSAQQTVRVSSDSGVAVVVLLATNPLRPKWLGPEPAPPLPPNVC